MFVRWEQRDQLHDTANCPHAARTAVGFCSSQCAAKRFWPNQVWAQSRAGPSLRSRSSRQYLGLWSVRMVLESSRDVALLAFSGVSYTYMQVVRSCWENVRNGAPILTGRRNRKRFVNVWSPLQGHRRDAGLGVNGSKCKLQSLSDSGACGARSSFAHDCPGIIIPMHTWALEQMLWSYGVGLTHRLLSSSFLGLPYRILNTNPKEELLRSLWVGLREIKGFKHEPPSEFPGIHRMFQDNVRLRAPLRP